ncbi:hypothetical protein B0H21DRAFT_689519 [Amylocystis lapponica]|nr:hypothetical protein B0H21DRAFT_689519 [Amylocystis lapponica]
MSAISSQLGQSQQFDYDPAFPERDERGGDDLPTYDDLAAQHGPNSRFGRWKQWIEKRHRYADITPEELQRRRARGWGDTVQVRTFVPCSRVHRDDTLRQADDTRRASQSASNRTSRQQLHIQTEIPSSAEPDDADRSPDPAPPAELIPEVLSPTHLKLYQFGSRFLPHTTAPIRCLLPLLNDRMLLIGHDDGLSVMDMFPKAWDDAGLEEKGPADAEVRHIWEGEGVFQMTILEVESTGQGTPQGVVLALVGPDADSGREQEGIRTLRMYNLASLLSLAKWALARKGARPLDLHHTAQGKNHATIARKHRPQTSLTKGLKNLISDSPIAQPQDSSSHFFEPQSSYSSVADSGLNTNRHTISAVDRSDSVDSQLSSWDVVEDLPLRWATHYTPLAAAGSRLLNTSILFFDLYRNEGQRSRGGALLAVATKSNIFLYEAPKGERAFHLVKACHAHSEFYTPLTARNITFVQHAVQDTILRSPSDITPRTNVLHPQRHSRVVSTGAPLQRHSHQLSLFVIFEKKAGLIRIADSAVGEVELYDENIGAGLLAAPAPGSPRRNRSSWDGRPFTRDKAPWVPPVLADLPAPPGRSAHAYVLTRGKTSHVVAYPLPAHVDAAPPLHMLHWAAAPAQVRTRVCAGALQVVAFGEDGVEVQEVLPAALAERKGKARAVEPRRAQGDVGGDTGYLCTGGLWDRPLFQGLTRSDSAQSYDSDASGYELSAEELAGQMRMEAGFYGWVRKGLEDWRVFWVGGTAAGSNNNT